MGCARDDELVRRARERFEALGLHWHAEHTRSLLDRRKHSTFS
jgi:hypothetical protein